MAAKLRAIDLFCGIGGWSTGLRLAGIDVVASYEWWPAALETYNANLGVNRQPTDIRKMKLASLPSNIDVVIGSPPCTEFSFANKGGGGDLVEGLKDIVHFFRVVRYLRPRYWVMENVPRVAELVESGLRKKRSPLYEFRDLGAEVRVINFSDYGLPQSRIRSLIGNIPFERLETYKAGVKALTLGQVISALRAKSHVVDPIWGAKVTAASLTENDAESPLDPEQLRMNRDAKVYHPVYNNMAFPDRLDVPSRTVTATCTRVSRESIIVPVARKKRQYRRLTIRERATLQGFPITYQFYNANYTDKVKTIGNAVPPPFAYLVASAIKGTPASELKPFSEVGGGLKMPRKKAPVALPNGRANVFPKNRTFRAAIPGLRFKSGMRFEFANVFRNGKVEWEVRFFYGSSKDIQSLALDVKLHKKLSRLKLVRDNGAEIDLGYSSVAKLLLRTDAALLQEVWSHRADGINPYQMVDSLGRAARKAAKCWGVDAAARCLRTILPANTAGFAKMERYAAPILAGLVLGSRLNISGSFGLKNQ